MRGEEIHTLAWALLRNDRAQYGGLAVAYHHGAIGLTRHSAGFEDQRASAPHRFFACNIEHILFPLFLRTGRPLRTVAVDRPIDLSVYSFGSEPFQRPSIITNAGGAAA